VGQGLGDEQRVGHHREPGDAGQPAGELLGRRTGADHDGLALFDETGREIGDGRLLRGGEVGFLREARLSGEASRQHRAAVPAIEEPFGLQCAYIPAYGHF
jgi:hypothetical protein